MKGLNPRLIEHFERPRNAGKISDHNCKGKDSSLDSKIIIIYYALIRDGIIRDISFRTFGCSYSIAASSLITELAKGKDLFSAAKIWEKDIEERLGMFPPGKKISLQVALGAYHAMLSSYIPSLYEEKPFSEKESRIAVALSGGLDSSMAARILKDEGNEVAGLTMKIMPDDSPLPEKRVTSWMSSDIYSARSVCSLLGIPHFTVDLSASFDKDIVKFFCSEYLKGRTPNPCVECNKLIKFGKLLETARILGAKYIATGHYCSVERKPGNGLFTVRKGKDLSKEQSYVFWKLDQSQLSRIKTPLGGYTKDEVRLKSRDLLASLEERDESQDICFIPNNSYQDFLKSRISDPGSGKILDKKGKKIGEHRGIPYYTIGQRRGLGVSHVRPLYVMKIIPEENVIIAGEKDELLRDSAVLKDVNFISGRTPPGEFKAEVKIRYNSPPAMARITMQEKDRAKAIFEKPVSSVTPGQSAVFYEGDMLLGGGVITC